MFPSFPLQISKQQHLLLEPLVAILGGVILGSNHKTTPLPRPTVHGLNDVDELLLVLESPVDLVVVPGAKINHNVLVPEEEHDGGRVVELVHGVEIRDLGDVHQVNHSKVFDRLRN